ncbi:E3 ubiquitin-protein ligase TRIM32-like [Homarus americanus]|uniref:E3 ubiquitin-protein ligase TRIM13-like 2 n=1 Tax=Homarus americanus TaxID=6706 RepID=A0A8J5N0N6_HOMAM|nr:E3 ubiquitin-protein ligase TRIM32-like [Homarus americanus]KAG7170257.1 E3 ubiquitin-protein ligase TRIM13-like 2 [Homarus americanus]
MEYATTCMVCLSTYGRKSAQPLVLLCGHTICRCCVTTLIRTGPRCCPKCKKEHSFHAFKNLPVNYDLLAVVEEYTLTRKEVCSSHEEQMQYWCRECQQPLCGQCLLRGHLEHGHEVITADVSIHEQKNDLRNHANHLQKLYSEDKRRTTSRFLEAINSVIQLCGRSDSLYELNKGVNDTFSKFISFSNFETMSSSKTQLMTLESEARAKGLLQDVDSELSGLTVSSACHLAPSEGASGFTDKEEPTISSSQGAAPTGLEVPSPNQGTTSTSQEAASVCQEAASVSQEAASVGQEGASVSQEGASASQEGASASQETASVSQEAASVSQEAASVSQEGASVSQEGASASQEGASVSQEGASASQEGASASQEEASASQEEASASQEGASASQEGASASQEDTKPTREVLGVTDIEEGTDNEDQRMWPLTCCVLVDEARQATLSWEQGKVLLSAPKDITVDPLVTIKLPVIEELMDKENPEVFLELSVLYRTLGRVHIRLRSHTHLAKQFLALCIGKLGPSFLGSKMIRVDNKDEGGEMLVGGQYKHPNPQTSTYISRRLVERKAWDNNPIVHLKEALVVGCSGGCPKSDTVFGICTKNGTEKTGENPVFGQVVSGMEVVRAAVSHDPVCEVFISNCGLAV